MSQRGDWLDAASFITLALTGAAICILLFPM